MKQYTTEEYDVKYSKHGALYTEGGPSWEFDKLLIICNCWRNRVFKLNGVYVLAYWKDCPNCFGYGISPLQQSELNK